MKKLRRILKSCWKFCRLRKAAMAQYKGAASEAGRAQQIMKRREREMEDLESKRRKVRRKSSKRGSSGED